MQYKEYYGKTRIDIADRLNHLTADFFYVLLARFFLKNYIKLKILKKGTTKKYE